MATPRSQQIDITLTPYYHCMTQCVRRAFLCGDDAYSGQNFDHRKEWVRDRLRYVASLFAIDICAYAAMSNHLHVVLHVDIERGASWPNDEVVRRHTMLYPTSIAAWEAKLSAGEREKLVAKWRSRLCSISWMMRELNEFIARKANREDGVRGRFWEGRFSSKPLLDEKGLLTCMAYVDLNPVRAGVADSLDGSDFTSIQERLLDIATNKDLDRRQDAPQSLAPFSDQVAKGEDSHFLPIAFADYVALLEWTGRALVPGKRGTLSEPPELLNQRGMSVGGWSTAMQLHGLSIVSAFGSVEALTRLAAARERKWMRGIGLARKLAA